MGMTNWSNPCVDQFEKTKKCPRMWKTVENGRGGVAREVTDKGKNLIGEVESRGAGGLLGGGGEVAGKKAEELPWLEERSRQKKVRLLKTEYEYASGVDERHRLQANYSGYFLLQVRSLVNYWRSIMIGVRQVQELALSLYSVGLRGLLLWEESPDSKENYSNPKYKNQVSR